MNKEEFDEDGWDEDKEEELIRYTDKKCPLCGKKSLYYLRGWKDEGCMCFNCKWDNLNGEEAIK